MDLYMAVDLTAARLIYTPLTHACQISLHLSIPLSLSVSLHRSLSLPLLSKDRAEIAWWGK